MDFKNKTVIVTGSARGIGRKIAEKFVAHGASVVICDLDQNDVERVAGELGENTIGIKADVTKQDDIESLFDKTLKQFGHIDIVVNNAGITRDTLMIRMNEKDWDMVLDINLKGAFLVTKTSARVMMKQRFGHIIPIHPRQLDIQ